MEHALAIFGGIVLVGIILAVIVYAVLLLVAKGMSDSSNGRWWR